MKQKDTMQNPWAGLSSYEDPVKSSQRLKFCGRDSETFDVSRLIDDNFFVTLYGKSGIGKTSLLNAGVFPALRREQYTPLSLRLGMSDKSQCFQDIITTAIERAVEETGGSARVIPVVEEQTDRSAVDYLWNWFARRQFLTAEGQTTFPVVVFDQFEEVFRQSDSRIETEVLLAQIHYLVDETHALSDCIVEGEEYSYDFNFRFVLSIREDDLYRLEDSIDNCALTALKRCRYRLRSLSEQEAREAILLPGEGLFRPEDQDGIVQTIIGIARNKEEQSISTNLLSLVCNRIFVEFQKNPDADFISRSLVDTFVKGNLFERFYDEATKGFSNREKSYIEEHLVDSTGRRNSMPESDFLLHVPNGAKLLEGDTRILQRSSVSTDGGNYRIELIHDSFCEPLSRQREKREKRRRARMMLAAVGVALVCAGIATTIFFLVNSNRSQKFTIAKQDKNLQLYDEQLESTIEQLKKEKDSVQLKAQQLEAALAQIDEKNTALKKEKDFALLKAQQLAVALDQIDEKNQKLEETLWNMMENKARYIAERGQKLIEDHDSYTARLLALAILPESLDNPDKPYVPEAEALLRDASCNDDGILRGHQFAIYSVAFSPNGKLVASGAYDKTVRIWDVETGRQIGQPLIGHTHMINSIAFSPDGKRIASASHDYTVRIWDVETGKQIGQPLIGHTLPVHSVGYSFDGKRILSASDDNTVRIWDAATGKYLGKFLEGYSLDINHIVLSSDAKWVIAKCGDHKVRIWDVTTEKQIGQPLEMSIGDNIAISPDGKWIAASTTVHKEHKLEENGETKAVINLDNAKHIVRIWDVETGTQKGDPLEGHTDMIFSLAFSPDSKRIISASQDKTVRVWDVETGKQIGKPFEGHSVSVSAVAFSPDGQKFASAGDNTVRLWNITPNHQVFKQITNYGESVYSVKISPDSKRLLAVSSSFHDSATRVWDIATGQQISQLLDNGKNRAASFSADGTQIVSISWNDTVYIWDAATGRLLTSRPMEHSGSIHYRIFSPDGQQVVSESPDSTLCVWDIRTGKQIGNPFQGNIDFSEPVAFSQDGNRIVSISKDNTICIWDVKTGKQIRQILLEPTNIVRDIAFSPDGNRIVSATYDNTVRIWDVTTGNQIGQLLGNIYFVLSVAFSPDGNRIVTGSTDNTVRIWDIHTGRQLGQPLVGHTSSVKQVSFSPDGKHILSLSNDGEILIWDFPPLQELIDETRKRFKDRQLTPEERRKYYLE